MIRGMLHDELELVEWLRQEQVGDPRVALGIGDDMAVLAAPRDFVLLSSDMLLDGVHFDSGRDEPSAIGRKALACNLSDCAAMAVRPVAAIVSLALPADMALDRVKEMYRGMFALARAFEVRVVGGDTTRWRHPLAIDVAVAAAPYDGVDPVTRSRARRGDRLYVTGPLGGSLNSGRHLRFTPRVREARGIAETLGTHLHAMMDISDGLSLDLWRMCEASGVGAVLDEAALGRVIHEDVRDGAQGKVMSEDDALERALSDGEDFELLLAADPAGEATGLNLFPIGEVVEQGLSLRRVGGSMTPLAVKGYVH